MLETSQGDTIRLTARNVHHQDIGAVISGLSGTAVVRNSDGEVVLTTPILLHITDDWYVDVEAPEEPGHYFVTLNLVYSGTHRTVRTEFFVR